MAKFKFGDYVYTCLNRRGVIVKKLPFTYFDGISLYVVKMDDNGVNTTYREDELSLTPFHYIVHNSTDKLKKNKEKEGKKNMDMKALIIKEKYSGAIIEFDKNYKDLFGKEDDCLYIGIEKGDDTRGYIAIGLKDIDTLITWLTFFKNQFLEAQVREMTKEEIEKELGYKIRIKPSTKIEVSTIQNPFKVDDLTNKSSVQSKPIGKVDDFSNKSSIKSKPIEVHLKGCGFFE